MRGLEIGLRVRVRVLKSTFFQTARECILKIISTAVKRSARAQYEQI